MELLNSMPKSERVLSLNEDLKKALKDLQKEIEESNFLINEESYARNFRYFTLLFGTCICYFDETRLQVLFNSIPNNDFTYIPIHLVVDFILSYNMKYLQLVSILLVSIQLVSPQMAV